IVRPREGSNAGHIVWHAGDRTKNPRAIVQGAGSGVSREIGPPPGSAERPTVRPAPSFAGRRKNRTSRERILVQTAGWWSDTLGRQCPGSAACPSRKQRVC